MGTDGRLLNRAMRRAAEQSRRRAARRRERETRWRMIGHLLWVARFGGVWAAVHWDRRRFYGALADEFDASLSQLMARERELALEASLMPDDDLPF